MGQTKDFFKEKKAWSVLKDEILDYYLVPYIAKILRTGKPLYIFDCFAFSESEYQKKIRQMEQDSDLIIDRVPAMTPKGKPATAMDYGKYKITVRKRI